MDMMNSSPPSIGLRDIERHDSLEMAVSTVSRLSGYVGMGVAVIGMMALFLL